MTSAADSVTWAAALGGVVAADADHPVTIDVDPTAWVAAALTARDDLGFRWFDALTVIDEADGSFHLVLHVVRRGEPFSRLALRTAMVEGAVASLGEVFAGAKWHEREQAEMFGVAFDGAADARRLLLPDAFAGAPLRKDFVLAARAARPWPGLKEPGESDADVTAPAASDSADAPAAAPAPRRRRRRAVPTGVPERDAEGRW